MSLEDTDQWASQIINDLFDRDKEMGEIGQDSDTENVAENEVNDRQFESSFQTEGTEDTKDAPIRDCIMGCPLQSKNFLEPPESSSTPENDIQLLDAKHLEMRKGLKPLTESINFDNTDPSNYTFSEQFTSTVEVSIGLECKNDNTNIFKDNTEASAETNCVAEEFLKMDAKDTEFDVKGKKDIYNAEKLDHQITYEGGSSRVYYTPNKITEESKIQGITRRSGSDEDEEEENQLKRIDEKVKKMSTIILKNRCDRRAPENQVSFLDAYIKDYFPKLYLEEEISSRFENSLRNENKALCGVGDVHYRESHSNVKAKDLLNDESYMNGQGYSGDQLALESMAKHDESSEFSKIVSEIEMIVNNSTNFSPQQHDAEHKTELEIEDANHASVKRSVHTILPKLKYGEQYEIVPIGDNEFISTSSRVLKRGIKRVVLSDDTITERTMKVIRFYRRLCFTVEIIFVKPVALFCAEAFDSIVFAFIICVYLLRLLYIQVKSWVIKALQELEKQNKKNIDRKQFHLKNHDVSKNLTRICEENCHQVVYNNDTEVYNNDTEVHNNDTEANDGEAILGDITSNYSPDESVVLKSRSEIFSADPPTVDIKFEDFEQSFDKLNKNDENVVKFSKEHNEEDIKMALHEYGDVTREEKLIVITAEEDADLEIGNSPDMPQHEFHATEEIVISKLLSDNDMSNTEHVDFNEDILNTCSCQNLLPDVSSNEESVILNSTPLADRTSSKRIHILQRNGDYYALSGNRRISLNVSGIGKNVEMSTSVLCCEVEKAENSSMDVNLSSSSDFDLCTSAVDTQSYGEDISSSSVRRKRPISVTNNEEERSYEIRESSKDPTVKLDEKSRMPKIVENTSEYSATPVKETFDRKIPVAESNRDEGTPNEVFFADTPSSNDLDFSSNESSDQNDEKSEKRKSSTSLRRRVSSILNSWKNVNVIPCVSKNPTSRKKYKKYPH